MSMKFIFVHNNGNIGRAEEYGYFRPKKIKIERSLLHTSTVPSCHYISIYKDSSRDRASGIDRREWSGTFCRKRELVKKKTKIANAGEYVYN